MNLPSGDEIHNSALQYLVDGNELNEAEALRQCTIEVGEVRYERGSVSEVDITLRCRRELMEKLRCVGPWEEPPELTQRLRNAIRAALPSGYGIANLDARATIPKLAVQRGGEPRKLVAPPVLRVSVKAPSHAEPFQRGANSTQPRKDLPEFFFTLQDAAAYAGKTKRTIQNWKTRGWLKAEQDGRMIRIARADLDKCKLRQ